MKSTIYLAVVIVLGAIHGHHAVSVRAVRRQPFWMPSSSSTSQQQQQESSPATAQYEHVSPERLQDCLDIFAGTYRELNEGQAMPEGMVRELRSGMQAPPAILKEMYPQEIYQSLLEPAATDTPSNLLGHAQGNPMVVGMSPITASTASMMDIVSKNGFAMPGLSMLSSSSSSLSTPFTTGTTTTSSSTRRKRERLPIKSLAPGERSSSQLATTHQASGSSSSSMSNDLLRHVMESLNGGGDPYYYHQRKPWPPLPEDPCMLSERGLQLQSLVDVYDSVRRLFDEPLPVPVVEDRGAFQWPESCRELLQQRVAQHMDPELLTLSKNPLELLDGAPFQRERMCTRTVRDAIVHGGRLLAHRIASWARELSPSTSQSSPSEGPLMYELMLGHRFPYQLLAAIVFITDDDRFDPRRQGTVSVRHLVQAHHQLKAYILAGVQRLSRGGGGGGDYSHTYYVRPSKTFHERKLIDMVQAVRQFRHRMETILAEHGGVYQRLLCAPDAVALTPAISAEDVEMLCTGGDSKAAVTGMSFHHLADLAASLIALDSSPFSTADEYLFDTDASDPHALNTE